MLRTPHLGHARLNPPVYKGMRDNNRRTPADPDLDQEFSLAWVRSSPTHELSAHGRNVQQRLDTPASRPVHPSVFKRLHFALYRIFKSRQR
jgi:hypothetical protein